MPTAPISASILSSSLNFPHNKTTLVRWRFVPQDGEKRLSDAELKSMPPNFLEQALIDRTKQRPTALGHGDLTR